MNKLISVLPYCSSDHASATRLLNWVKELDGHLNHALLLVADDAVPMEIKKSIDALGKSIFDSAETIMVKAPAPVNGNYHPPAAMMFERAMGHIDACFKWNWFWMEPDCVPLKSGWLDALANGYDNCPKRFMGALTKVSQEGLPPTIMYATAVYPNCAHEDLKKFCDGKQAFDMAFSSYVVPRAANTELIWHRFGTPTDVPTFKEFKSPTDGPNVGTLDLIPEKAVVFHRNKDGTLIELLRKRAAGSPMIQHPNESDVLIAENLAPEPVKRRPGRPPKVHPESQTA